MVLLFSGKPGSGKTLSVVHYLARDKRKTIFSNVKLNIPGKEVYMFSPKKYAEIRKLRNGIVFVDEANFVFASRFWRNIPREMLQFWAMHRKYGVDLIITSHSLKRVDIVLRELVSYDIHCRMIGPFCVNVWYDVDYDEKVKTVLFFGAKYFHMYDTLQIVQDTAYEEG